MTSRRVMHRKVLRDLRRRLPQAAAIALTTLLGVLLFVASYDSFRNLSVSYQQTYERLHFADLTADGGDPASIAQAVRDADGVARVSVRTQADVPMTIAGTKLVGRVSGLAPDERQRVDDIDLVSGSMPDHTQPREVVLEKHAADTFGLGAGSAVRVFDGESWHELRVTGVARSPEYLWPARDRQDVLSDPHSFAVLFVPQDNAAALTGSPGPNETLVEMSGQATTDERDQVAGLLRSAGALHVQPRADQASNAALHEDLAGFSEMSVAFPALFLTAAAIAEYVLLTRLVRAERPVIGTLLAMGARRGAIVRHYTWYGVVIAGVGSLAGVLLGALGTSAVTIAYTSALHIPDTVVDHRVLTAVVGFALGVGIGLLGALAPAITAVTTAPAEAMRGDGSRTVRAGAVARLSTRWTAVPVTVRMAVRSLVRSPRRTAATMTGTVLALVLMLASAGMITSMVHLLDVQFGEVDRTDATLQVDPGATDVGERLRATPGVAAVEPGMLAPAVVAAGDKSYDTVLAGMEPDTTMHGFRTPGGAYRDLPSEGILAGDALVGELGIEAGDTVTVTPASGSPTQVRVAGFVHEPLGTYLYATDETAGSIAPLHAVSYALRFSDTVSEDRMRATISSIPGVLSYTDTRALLRQADQYLALFWVFVGVMLGLGAVLAFTVIYVTMTVNFAERSTELATLRAAGVPIRRLTTALAAENLAATVLALPVGLAAGAVAAWAFLRSFSNDMFSLDLSLGWVPLTLAAVSVVAAAALSQLPAARLLRRIDIARIVRERAQ
ncbi:ABC transporter permease [Myceligenerans indicum]|uniref:ABC transporter permease n=1 Tax=Myceligenerans indicum TaxID=2593663 RepID=UPI00191F4CD7|nr:FtsX-like permease family protein [Myceligenerans indicum]